VKAGEALPVALTVQIGTPEAIYRCESNRDQDRARRERRSPGVKRAILPAATSGRTVIRLLAEVRRRGQPPRRRGGRL